MEALLQGSFLSMRVCIFPLTVSSPGRAGDGDSVCSDLIMEWTSCLPSTLRKKGSPGLEFLLLHRKKRRRPSYWMSDIEQVPLNSSLSFIRQKPKAGVSLQATAVRTDTRAHPPLHWRHVCSNEAYHPCHFPHDPHP